MKFEKARDEIKIQGLDLEREKQIDWIDPDKELSEGEWQSVITAVRKSFKNVFESSDRYPNDWIDPMAATIAMKLLRPTLTKEDFFITNNIEKDFIEDFSLKTGFRSPQLEIEEYLYAVLFDPSLAEESERLTFESTMPTLAQDVSTESSFPNLLRSFAFSALSNPSRKDEFPLEELWGLAIKRIEELNGLSNFFQLIETTGQLHVLFPDRVVPRLPSGMFHLMRGALRGMLNDQKRIQYLPEVILWASAATTPSLRIEKGRVIFEPPIAKKTAIPPPVMRNF